MKRAAIVLATLTLMLGGFSGTGSAARSTTSWCGVIPSETAIGEPYVVHVEGLPKSTAITLWIIHPDGYVEGMPLGGTPDGTFDITAVSDTPGVWSYEFTGVVKGKYNMRMYALCSEEAS